MISPPRAGFFVPSSSPLRRVSFALSKNIRKLIDSNDKHAYIHTQASTNGQGSEPKPEFGTGDASPRQCSVELDK
jgi:hypothetical protein